MSINISSWQRAVLVTKSREDICFRSSVVANAIVWTSSFDAHRLAGTGGGSTERLDGQCSRVSYVFARSVRDCHHVIIGSYWQCKALVPKTTRGESIRRKNMSTTACRLLNIAYQVTACCGSCKYAEDLTMPLNSRTCRQKHLQ
jgi:hypothetical protein